MAKVEPIRTAAELANLVGRNRAQVGRWVARPDWTFGKAPWSRAKVPEILRWAAGHLRDRSDVKPVGAAPDAKAAKPKPSGGGGSDLVSLKEKKLAAEVRKLEAQAGTAETVLARERGRLMDAADVESRWVRLTTAVRNGFAAVPAELVDMAITAGLPRGGAQALTRQFDLAVGRVLSKLSGENDGDAGDD